MVREIVIDMCRFYNPHAKNKCEAGLTGSLRCHSKNYACPRYKHSVHYAPGEEYNGKAENK